MRDSERCLRSQGARYYERKQEPRFLLSDLLFPHLCQQEQHETTSSTASELFIVSLELRMLSIGTGVSLTSQFTRSTSHLTCNGRSKAKDSLTCASSIRHKIRRDVLISLFHGDGKPILTTADVGIPPTAIRPATPNRSEICSSNCRRCPLHSSRDSI